MQNVQRLSETLRERGYVNQFSGDSLEEITDGPKRTLYLGVDPTADSMHVGQLQGILILRRFIEAGHKLIILIGAGTGMVGDPGGKSTERNLLSDATVDSNAEALKKQFAQLLGTVDFQMVNNADWLRSISMMEFLRDVGKHFTVNEMIKRDSVRPRLETPEASISYTEFSYMLLQAYDYLHLNQELGCDLQVGGSDQWGNIISGVDLIRKKTAAEAFAFSWPLLVDKKTGKKFGKSEGGTVWLDANKTSPFQFYQFWLNTEDDAVEELLLKMTLLSQANIDAIVFNHNKTTSERSAQKRLALEVTTLVHGLEKAKNAEDVSSVLFGDSHMDLLSENGILLLRSSAPTEQIREGESIVDILVRAGLATSKREARQFIQDEAITLNGESVDESKTCGKSDLPHGIAILKRGKRNVVVLTLD
jgi:tyrosyl-tRNA synthetase